MLEVRPGDGGATAAGRPGRAPSSVWAAGFVQALLVLASGLGGVDRLLGLDEDPLELLLVVAQRGVGVLDCVMSPRPMSASV